MSQNRTEYSQSIIAKKREKQPFQIIPAIDIIDGKCVRLTQGDYSRKTVYNDRPLEVAKAFADAGLERLHLVDLDGAREGTIVHWKLLEQLATVTSLRIDFGGGIKSDDDVRILFESGAEWATIGSVAVKEPLKLQTWILAWGADKFFLGADAKEGKLAIHGWTETTDIPLLDFLTQWKEAGITQVFTTDVAKDGLLEGPAILLYEEVLVKLPELPLYASGGVRDLNDLDLLSKAGLAGAIVGKAIYEGRITLAELVAYNQKLRAC